MSSKILFGFLILMLNSIAYAEPVYPVSSGKWYSKATQRYIDSCSRPHFIYTNLTADIPALVAELLLQKERNGCSWTSPSRKFSTAMPEDFPGSKKEWENLLKKSSSNNPQQWTSHCISDDGATFDNFSITLYPQFHCPYGSRDGIMIDKGNYRYGCTTTPIPCFADIVGRDLDVTGLGSVGHIGLTAGNYVNEVLNDEPAIQVNTIQDFRNKTAFWGEKYGLPKHENLLLEQGIDIMDTAAKQTQCQINYTFRWKYQPCEAGRPGTFRCDSFVYYSYKEGAKLKIGEYTPLITYPINLFSRFLHCRLDGSIPCNAAESTIGQEQFLTLTPNKLLTNRINNEFAKDNLDIMTLDQLTTHYLSEKTIPRKNKISLLWNLMQQYKTDHNRFEYITNTLSDLTPHEIIPKIIHLYQQESDRFIKSKLVNLLVDSLAANPLLKSNPNFEKAHEFFKSTISNEYDPSLIAQFIAYYPRAFFDSNTYQMLIDKIEDLKKQDINQCSDAIAYNYSFWGRLFQFMMDQKGQQSFWFEKIAALVEKYSDDQDFKTHLPQRLKQQYKHNDFLVSDMFYITLGDMMRTIKPGELDTETHDRILQYLRNHIRKRALPLTATQELINATKQLAKDREEDRLGRS